MGKSNRIRVNKAGAQIKSVGVRKEKKGMPSWAMNLIAILITLAVLALAAIPFMSTNGIFGRMQTAMKSEHFSVNQNMMTYYFNASYQSFCSQYSSYISNGNFSLDPSKDLKAQTFGDTSTGSGYETYFVGAFEGTWFDYFMSQTTSEVETMLFYCEEAYARGWELGDEQKASIDQTIDSLTDTALSNEYGSLNLFLSQNFGEGIQEQDVRDALKLSELASLCSTRIGEEILSGISAEEVNATYDATAGVDIDGNGTNVNKVDYTYYTFTVKYSDMEGADDAAKLAAYKAAVIAADEKANSLKGKTDLEAFEEFILPLVVEDKYDAEYKNAVKPSSETAAPSDENLTAIRKALIEKIIEEIKNEVESTSLAYEQDGEKYTVCGVELAKEWATMLDTIKKQTLSGAKTAISGYSKDRVEYMDSDPFSTWAFNMEAGLKAGDTFLNATGDTVDKLNDVNSTNATQFTANVYLLRTPAGKDTTTTKNLSYMIFTSEENAEAAIKALVEKGTVNAEIFEEVAHTVNPDVHDELENYVKGNMGSTAFDDWAYGETTTVGSFTTTPIALDSSTYAVLYYASEGEQTWFVQVKEVLYSQKFEAKYEEIKSAYGDKMEKKEGVLNAISAVKLNFSSSSSTSLV